VIEALQVARELGIDETDCNKAATAASELARNILKYAGSGEVLVEPVMEGSRAGIGITATDRGPGIVNIDQAMDDHFSSSGTLGLGLPGVKRMMDEFAIDSTPGRGTRVLVRMWRGHRVPDKGRQANSILMRAVSQQASYTRAPHCISGALTLEPLKCGGRLESASFVRACRGELVSGDVVMLERRSGLLFVAIIDALGHGASANAAAKQAVGFLQKSWSSDVVKTIHELHEALKDTIGAAVGICVVEAETRAVRYAGVGNTVLRTFGARPTRLNSSTGTLGAQLRGVHEQRLQLSSKDILVMYTDGVSDRFGLDKYPTLLVERPEMIVRSIVEQFGKSHDDASCVALRYIK
jgi:anti-sigma regulatory factor (Ser/Thr protein kinase)